MSEQNNAARRVYESPQLTRVGTLEDVTQSLTGKPRFDFPYVAGQLIPNPIPSMS